MTGKITVGTIQDTDGNTVASTFVTNGVAKALQVFIGGTTTLDKSLNTTSLTDNGTGDYTITFTNAFDSLDYVHNGSVSVAATSASTHSLNDIDAASPRAAGSIRLECFLTNSSNNRFNFDNWRCQAIQHGDLA